jgi:hypothetical protein
VAPGQLLGDIGKKELGATLHAPVAALVGEVSDQCLILEPA